MDYKVTALYGKNLWREEKSCQTRKQIVYSVYVCVLLKMISISSNIIWLIRFIFGQRIRKNIMYICVPILQRRNNHNVKSFVSASSFTCHTKNTLGTKCWTAIRQRSNGHFLNSFFVVYRMVFILIMRLYWIRSTESASPKINSILFKCIFFICCYNECNKIVDPFVRAWNMGHTA